jgi:hypothetical protein
MISWFGREDLRDADPIRIKNVKEKMNENRIVGKIKITRKQDGTNLFNRE